jgi:sugar O-acyltransferase (sialic acid O-acetyltransferase NeuD family)
MSRLAIVTASGLAREALAVERELGRRSSIAILDDDPRLWGSSVDGVTVIGGLDVVHELADHEVLVCAGPSRTRRRLVQRLTAAGVGPERFAVSVHPRVNVPPGCTIGPGCILLEGVVMTTGVSLGAHVVAMPHVTLTHDDVVEDCATLCAGVSLGGGVRVGSAAYLGMNASVREGRSVGDGAVLGMGAVLTQDLPAGETWVGVPARRSHHALEVSA